MSEASDHITVYLEEEYGYRDWIWRTGMTAADLVAWWEAQERLPFFTPKGNLPGEVVRVHVDDDGMHVVIEEEDDDYDPKNDPEDNGYYPTGEVVPWPVGWNSIANPDPRPRAYWSAHIHINDDTFLQGPDETFYLHRGYTGKR